jgi:hypothetical protein
MSYELLFVGVGGTVIGTLLGSWLTARLTYGFQKQLLRQQLDFLKQQGEDDAKLRNAIHVEWKAIFTEFRNMLNTRVMNLGSRL